MTTSTNDMLDPSAAGLLGQAHPDSVGLGTSAAGPLGLPTQQAPMSEREEDFDDYFGDRTR